GQSRDPAPNHQADVAGQGLRIVVGVGKDQVVALCPGIVLRALVNVNEKWILHVGDNHAHRAALTSGEIAGMQVRMIPKLFGGSQNARPGGFLDGTNIVQNSGDSSSGNLRSLSDFCKIHGGTVLYRYHSLSLQTKPKRFAAVQSDCIDTALHWNRRLIKPFGRQQKKRSWPLNLRIIFRNWRS